ncbi:MAG: hypothetical protein EAZ97_14130 [Bacteroidetes bacterium]|nr:MAG: hypothetical protein EAZ97_14130 [Bacteroidota bacterium]
MDFSLINCQFLINDSLRQKPQFFVCLKNSIFSNLRIIETKINGSFDLENAVITNNFQITKSKIKDNLLISGTNINPLGTRLEWATISRRLSIYHLEQDIFFNHNNLDSIPLTIFNDLFSNYSIIYSAFKIQGNRYSTNQCYIEWKNLETAYLHKLYQQNQDFNVYFTYLMNVFLGIFCDYGTNPLKSIYISFYVMLIFSMVYFFIPHNFGHQRDSFWSSLIGYISQINTISDIKNLLLTSQKNYFGEQKQIEIYLDTIKKHEKSFYYYIIALPNLIYFYLKKLYMTIYFTFSIKFINFTEKMKFLGNLTMFFIFLYWIFKKIFIRLLDCIALSMNIFTTLGFGSTEMTGVPMYLTVIEGFIGWLLLSFFSLSLISQLVN